MTKNTNFSFLGMALLKSILFYHYILSGPKKNTLLKYRNYTQPNNITNGEAVLTNGGTALIDSFANGGRKNHYKSSSSEPEGL